MSEREVLEYDVVIVGAGPAGLACAIRLKQLAPHKSVCVIEKGAQVGAHILSGAVIQPDALDVLLPDWRRKPPPICVPVVKSEFIFLSRRKRVPLLHPPQMHNHGNFIVSLGALCAWLAPQAEAVGVEIYPGFAATEALLNETGAVAGVRIGDHGINKQGRPKPNYTPGIDIKAGVTVLAEGCRGSLTKQLTARYALDQACSPQTYGIGFKELWQLPAGRARPGLVQHTLGWPLPRNIYGGGFLYHLDQDRVAIGVVSGLDYEDAHFAPFEYFQQFKHHPAIKPLLEGGTIISAGARALVEGGIQALPKLEMPGALLIGDTAGMLNVPKIKGTHLAMWSGMLAAEHLARHGSSAGFDRVWRASPSAKELYKVRNIRPGFRWGFWAGLANAVLETVTLGYLPWTLRHHGDWNSLKKSTERPRPAPDFVTRTLPPRDRLASVYFAATEHDEDQPVHLKVADTNICSHRCRQEYNNPCTRFCPAQVYEMVDNGSGGVKLHINAANCVHCKTCDIKDPYGIITWVPPEGGAGPNYQNL